MPLLLIAPHRSRQIDALQCQLQVGDHVVREAIASQIPSHACTTAAFRCPCDQIDGDSSGEQAQLRGKTDGERILKAKSHQR
jgi:hypothetical protein